MFPSSKNVDSSRGTSGSSPKHDWTSISVAKPSRMLGSIGRFDIPTWGFCPNISWYGVLPPIPRWTWVLQRHCMKGRACAQCLDLLACIQLEIFSSTVQFRRSTPPLDSECLGFPVTSLVPGQSFLISSTTPEQNFEHIKRGLVRWRWFKKKKISHSHLPLHPTAHVST